MFLTTEPNLPGKSYVPLRVIFGVGVRSQRGVSEPKSIQASQLAITHALAELEREATQLGADGVIGVHLSISETGAYFFFAAIMGTAIKFQNP